MLKTFFVQTNEINKITDVIEFPHEDYKEIQLNTPLPYGIMGGAYKLTESGVVYVKEWDNNELLNKISILEAENEQLNKINQEQDQILVDNAYKITILEMNLGGM